MSGHLRPQDRLAALAALGSEPLDVLVVGGGVVGAGAALDAVSRGLTVGLIEKADWASGSSSQSSKLIHGGLRYLELLDFRLVHEALQERNLLLDRLAPHLVHRVPFLYPLHGHAWERAYVGAGLLLYEALAHSPGRPRVVPAHRHISRRTVRRIAQSLRLDGVTGAVQYYDAQVDDARFVLALVRTAAAYGVRAAPRVEATELLIENGHVVGVHARDTETGNAVAIRARVVVSATGVWTDSLLGMAATDSARPGRTIAASKGAHLVVPRDRIRSSTGIITRTGSSVLLIIPWARHWIIGTTDTPWRHDPEQPAAAPADVDYLLAEVNRHLASPLTRDDVLACYAGLRPLLAAEAPESAKLSREHAVSSPLPGLVAVAGGKYTTYRVMAADAIDSATTVLGGLVAESVTDRLPLLGAEGYLAHWNQRHLLARNVGLPVARIEHLLRRYGSLAVEVLDLLRDRPELATGLPGAEDYLAAEIVYAVLAEDARDLEDLLARRTRIAIETADRGSQAAASAAKLAGPLLGWDAAEQHQRVAAYRRWASTHHAPS